MSAAFYIRPARDTPEDIDAILRLIKNLAIYEKDPDAAKGTPELIKQNLFQHKYAETLLAFEGTSQADEGKAVGMALYFFNFSTWTSKPGLYLEDLYVEESHRFAGIGKALFARLAKIAKEKDCARMEWVVLKWNEPSIKFYEKIGAVPLTEWQGMRLTGDALDRLEYLK